MSDEAPEAPEKSTRPDGSDQPNSSKIPARSGFSVDRIVALMLLVLAAFTVFGSLGDYLNLVPTINQALADLRTQMPSFPEMTYSDDGLAKPVGAVIITVEGLVLGIVIWWTIRRMAAGKLAFWVPLVGFALNSFIVGAGLMVCLLSDPTFVAALDTLK